MLEGLFYASTSKINSRYLYIATADSNLSHVFALGSEQGKPHIAIRIRLSDNGGNPMTVV